jgi:hypothetical protein
MKGFLARDLRLQKFTRRWVLHTLSDTQKIKRFKASTELTQILNDLEVDSFDGIRTGDKSWFQYCIESLAMSAKSPGDVVARMITGIGVQKTMATIFFTDKKLRVAVDLPKGQRYNQAGFISDILTRMERQKEI